VGCDGVGLEGGWSGIPLFRQGRLDLSLPLPFLPPHALPSPPPPKTVKPAAPHSSPPKSPDNTPKQT